MSSMCHEETDQFPKGLEQPYIKMPLKFLHYLITQSSVANFQVGNDLGPDIAQVV